MTAEERLAELAQLPPNWDSYGAPPVAERAVDAMRAAVQVVQAQPIICPTTDGGLQIEWELPGGLTVWLEASPDGRLSVETDGPA